MSILAFIIKAVGFLILGSIFLGWITGSLNTQGIILPLGVMGIILSIVGICLGKNRPVK